MWFEKLDVVYAKSEVNDYDMAKKEASDLMKRLEIKKDNLKVFTYKYLKEMMKKWNILRNWLEIEFTYHQEM